MSPNYRVRKVNKKQRRCEAIIRSECAIQSSEEPTRYLAVLNAGLSTGLKDEVLLSATEPHGKVIRLALLPNKSYCFLECASTDDAESIFNGMHNVSMIGQNGTVVFLAYFEQLPKTAVESHWYQKPLPPGLILVPDFVDEAEEEAILMAIGDYKETNASATLKHRRVKHFGYEFLYGVNNVDTSEPLQQEIPGICDSLWPRFHKEASAHNLTLTWQTPDQLTVNEYEPGQGIPPHVDTHSAFQDAILSLSLLGDIVMDFRHGEERIPVLLPRRSLLIMSGESRYDWTHGITPRSMDVVPSASGTLTTKRRTRRIALTFRRLRRGPCNCSFPTLCDTAATKEEEVNELTAARLEEHNVHAVYDQIANHFSETRHTPWPKVAAFLDSFPCGAVLLDVGCGNGKYLGCNRNTLTIGCDRSCGLLGVCQSRNASTFRCDCMNVPMRSQSVDGCISIAVIHHLATRERRLAAICEMARLLRSGGRALIYVWAKDQRAGERKSSYLLQNKAVNKHKSTEEQQRQVTLQQLDQEGAPLKLPIHTNRTDFREQDVLVPWKLKGAHAEAAAGQKPTTFLRYYHVFEQAELQELVEQVPEVTLLQSYYDQGNHCVIFQRN